MLTLYHCKNTRSIRVRQLLIELDLPFTLERVPYDFGATGGDAYKAVNPIQKVPALKDGDQVLVESVAIMQYVLDVHAPDSWLGVEPTDPEYGKYLQWLHYGEAGLGIYVVMAMAHAYLLPEEHRSPAMAKWGKRETLKILALLERGLGEKEYVLERGFTAADISIGYMFLLMKFAKILDDAPANVRAYAERLFARPSWTAASAD